MIDIKRILCPVDFSDCSERALDVAVGLASWYDATVHALHVMPWLPPSSVNALSESTRQLTRKNLVRLVSPYERPGVLVDTEVFESSDTTGSILKRADELDADIVVMGSHGRTGIRRALLGSTVESLLHRSRRPVIVVPSHLDKSRLGRPVRFGRIVCAVDFSMASLAGLEYAFSIAEESDAELTLLNVIERRPELEHAPLEPDFDIERYHADAEAKLRVRLAGLIPVGARVQCIVETAVMEGTASSAMLEFAEARNTDLIVIGVHGRNALDLALFGSTSRDVVIQAQCPILVVPAGPRRTLRAAS